MDEQNKLPEELADKYDYTTYLIGSMEKTAEGDDGTAKRADVEKELYLRGVYPINPVKLEAGKTGMTTNELKEKMVGWITSGHWDLFAEKSKEIWMGSDAELENGALVHVMGDVDYVLMSDWITMSYNKGDAPCGTFAEAGIALEHHIPIYLVTNLIKRDLPKSLLQIILASGGEVFETLNQYLEFIDKEYKLKRKEEKK
jgi:hypothetical protein